MEISVTSLFVISLTINICVMSSIGMATLLRLFLSRILGARHYLVRYKDSAQENPAFFRRVYLDIMFNGASMVTGVILMSTSNVLTNPFLELSQRLKTIFTVAVGWQLFKIFQNICDSDKTARYSKTTSVLRLVAVVHYSSTIVYKQSSLLGVLGLVIEGHALFFKLDKLWRILKVSQKGRFYLISIFVTAITAFLLRVALPLITLVIITRFHWKEILLMDYLPLAIFFLCLVFYTAANLWFLKVAFEPIVKLYSTKEKRQVDAGGVYTINPTVPGFIHNDLWTGKGRTSTMNINFNSPSFVRYSGTLQPMCVQDF